jgi:hypothetical protein
MIHFLLILSSGYGLIIEKPAWACCDMGHTGKKIYKKYKKAIPGGMALRKPLQLVQHFF